MDYDQAEDRARAILREGGSTCAQIAKETGLPEWHVVEMSHEIHEERDRLIGDIRIIIGALDRQEIVVPTTYTAIVNIIELTELLATGRQVGKCEKSALLKTVSNIDNVDEVVFELKIMSQLCTVYMIQQLLNFTTDIYASVAHDILTERDSVLRAATETEPGKWDL